MFQSSKNFEASKINNALLLSYFRLLRCALGFWSVIDKLVLIGVMTRQVLLGELKSMGPQRWGLWAVRPHHWWSHRDGGLPNLMIGWSFFGTEILYPTSSREKQSNFINYRSSNLALEIKTELN
jgi:hypothetical protein